MAKRITAWVLLIGFLLLIMNLFGGDLPRSCPDRLHRNSFIRVVLKETCKERR